MYYVEAKGVDFEALLDAMLMEQFLNSIHKNVRDFVLAKSHVTAQQCSMYADLCDVISRNHEDDVNDVHKTDSVVSQPHQATGAKGASLVSPGDYTGETMTCSGVFDGQVSRREVPLAIIKLRSARLECDENVSVEVGVNGK